jgi:hypothetical protein
VRVEDAKKMYGSSSTVAAGAATTTAGAGLAFTGAHVLALVVLAVGLLFAGMSMLGLSRRWRRPRAVDNG